MFRSLLFITLLITSSLPVSSPQASASVPVNTILVVGDSISAAYGIDTNAGWVNLLASKITHKKIPYQVINASISGDTTINGVKRLPALLSKYKPAIVIIELGGNDGLRGLSLKTMKDNLKQMIVLSKNTKAKIVLAGMKIPPNYGKRYTEAFYKTYQTLKREYALTLIPFILEGIGDKKELMQKDGLHPTQKAQAIIMQTVWSKLKPML